MPLNLEEARRALSRLRKRRPKHVRVFSNHLMAWFFEPTTDPNVEYEIILRYDGKELTVAKVQVVRIEPVALTTITKFWKGNPIIEGLIERVRNTLELPPRTAL